MSRSIRDTSLGGVIEIKTEITYFEKPGAHNTEETLKLAKKRKDELGIEHVVIATTSGRTAVEALKYFGENELIVVASQYGKKKPNKTPVTEENMERLKGVKLIFGTYAFSGVGRAINGWFGGISPLQLIANTLKLFSEGTKVCLEITLMAADAGAVPIDKEIIAMGGTVAGCDTAMVLQPAYSFDFFNIGIREIICRPRERLRKWHYHSADMYPFYRYETT